MSKDLGRVAKENIKLEAVFRQKPNINWLSFARFFLFGSRDLWFEVPLPFYLRSADGLNWPRTAVGAALAGYIIVYGQCQSHSPRLVLTPLRQSPPNKYVCMLWNALLGIIPLFLGVGVFAAGTDDDLSRGEATRAKAGVVVAGLVAFALVFAVNSAVHSYLVVKYADGDKVAMNVGFYYMANAFGRLVGTIGSGALYSYVSADVDVGLAACFFAAIVFVALSGLVTTKIDDDEGGLRWGTKLRCLGARPWAEVEAERAREKAALAEEEARKGGG